MRNFKRQGDRRAANMAMQEPLHTEGTENLAMACIKLVFENEAAAKAAIRPGARLFPYKCALCARWHLTSQAPRRRR